jgi:hypothetical protein
MYYWKRMGHHNMELFLFGLLVFTAVLLKIWVVGDVMSVSLGQ